MRTAVILAAALATFTATWCDVLMVCSFEGCDLARARQLAPSVVLIDELDSIAPRRDRARQHHDVQVLSQLLVLLDGLEARGAVAIVATSNRLEAIDPALRRPGRFDYHI